MDKSLMIFVAVGIGFLYLLTDFIGNIQEEDENLQSTEYKEKHKLDGFKRYDSIGRKILDVRGEPDFVQVEAWNKATEFRKEFLEIFPDFTEMRFFVKERLRGEEVQAKLLKKIYKIEGDFLSGSISSEDAKDKFREPL